MTESVEVEDPETVAKNAAARERYREKIAYDVDLKLDMALDLIFGHDDEHVDNSASFTLITGGGVIQGLAVHHRKYAYSQSEQVAKSSANIGETLRLVQEGLEKLTAERLEEQKDQPRPRRAYIHFLNATVTNGSYVHHLTDLRVDLKSVIGWSFGAHLPES